MEYPFKTEPFKHQREEWERSREEPARAIFWDQGTGKSKLTIDTACWLWLRGLIDGVLVVAPNGVHRNWVENEIPDHVPDEVIKHVRAFHYQSPKADTKWHKQAVRLGRSPTGQLSALASGPHLRNAVISGLREAQPRAQRGDVISHSSGSRLERRNICRNGNNLRGQRVAAFASDVFQLVGHFFHASPQKPSHGSTPRHAGSVIAPVSQGQ